MKIPLSVQQDEFSQNEFLHVTSTQIQEQGVIPRAEAPRSSSLSLGTTSLLSKGVMPLRAAPTLVQFSFFYTMWILVSGFLLPFVLL